MAEESKNEKIYLGKFTESTEYKGSFSGYLDLAKIPKDKIRMTDDEKAFVTIFINELREPMQKDDDDPDKGAWTHTAFISNKEPKKAKLPF